mgnify:FL=1|tara:strand:+ start:167 stop:574 length:408 start_codon:yes stop_codon:yes gene_type:complete
MTTIVSQEKVLLDVINRVGKIEKSKEGSFVHMVSFSHVLEMWVETDIVYMGTHYKLLKSPIQDDVMAANEGEIIVTDHIGDFFKVITTLRGENELDLWNRNINHRITNKSPMNYSELGIPDTAYIAFVGAAITSL